MNERIKKSFLIITVVSGLIFNMTVSGETISIVRVTASSVERNDSNLKAENAVDGNKKTRWASEFSDPQWLELDMGGVKEIVGLTIDWEAAYARAYDILLSENRGKWDEVYSTKSGDGLTDDIYFGKKKARYIKILLKERATNFGYSIWETAARGAEEEIITKASSYTGMNMPDKIWDNNKATGWSSDKEDESWISMDLRKKRDIGGLSLLWGENYPSAYEIKTSPDNKKWSSLYTENACNGGTDEISINMLDARYIKITCKNNKQKKVVSLKEIKIKEWDGLAKASNINNTHGLSGWENCEDKIFVGNTGSFASDKFQFMVSFWIYDHDMNKLYTPETIKTDWHLAEKGIPISIAEWGEDKLYIKASVFSNWREDIKQLVTFSRVNIANNSPENKNISLFAVISPNPMGKGSIRKIGYTGDNTISINDRKGLILKEKAVMIKGKDSSYRNIERFGKFKLLTGAVKQITGEKGAAVFKKNIGPGKTFNFDFIMPSGNISPKMVSMLDFDSDIKAVKKYWSERVPMKISLPDDRYTDCFYASIYYQLMLMHNFMLCPGPFNYKKFFLHDAVDMASSLNIAGLHKVSEKALAHFDYKEGTNYVDELGGNIFALYEHYRFTGDKKFLEKYYTRILEKCRLIKKMRSKQMTQEFKNTPFYGLMPVSLSQDNWKYPSYLYVDDWWALAGLKSAVETAKVLKKGDDISWIKNEYDDLHRCLMESFKRVMKRDNIDYIPGFADYWGPEMRVVDDEHRILGHTQMAWAHRPALYPGISLGINPPMDILADSYRYFWKEAGKFSGYDGGWYVEYEKLFWGYNVKLAQPMMYLGMCDITLKNMEWSLDNQSCPCGWMEAMPTKVDEKGHRIINTKGGIVGDVPHGWIAAHYIILLRNMLIREESGKLVILTCVPEKWFTGKKPVELENVPTYFGTVNYTVGNQGGKLKVKVTGSAAPPDGFVFKSPFQKKNIKNVKINNKQWKEFSDKEVMFNKLPAEIEIYY